MSLSSTKGGRESGGDLVNKGGSRTSDCYLSGQGGPHLGLINKAFYLTADSIPLAVN